MTEQQRIHSNRSNDAIYKGTKWQSRAVASACPLKWQLTSAGMPDLSVRAWLHIGSRRRGGVSLAPSSMSKGSRGRVIGEHCRHGDKRVVVQ